MPTRNLLSRPLLLTALVFAPTLALAQDIPVQRIGGAGTFDTAPNTSASDTSTARRQLTNLSSVPEDFFVLKLAPGFLLHMQVYDVPELTTDLRVDANGDISVPMLGNVHVAGKTITEAQTDVATRLRTGEIIKNPQVNLNIEQYASQNVSVIGEVHSPGRVELLSPRNLADVLALVGGETQYAGNIIDIRRKVDGQEKELHIKYEQSKRSNALDHVDVLPGDIVTVRRAGIVYVLGGVNRPGGYIMQEDGNLSIPEAISLAAGTTINASIGGMRVVRKNPDGTLRTIAVPYRKITAGESDAVTLQAEDVVYVPISKMKTVLSSAVTAGVAGAAIYAYH